MSSRRPRNRLLKPLEQDIGEAIACLDVNETKETREHSRQNTRPDEPHQVVRGKVVEKEITEYEKDLKESISKNCDILSSLLDPDDVLASKLRAPIRKFRELHPKMINLGKKRYATAIRRNQHHKKARVETSKTYFTDGWNYGLNESCTRLRGRYDFRELSKDQKSQLFRVLPILTAVQNEDANELHDLLETTCVHYRERRDVGISNCSCAALTTVWDSKRRAYTEGNIILFAAANLRYEFLEDLVRAMDITKNQHLKSLMEYWLREYGSVVDEAIFYNNDLEGCCKDGNKQIKTIQVLTSDRYRALANYRHSFTRIISYKHRNDYMCSTIRQNLLTYAAANKQWAIIEDIFLKRLGFDKDSRDLIPLFLVELVYTRDAAQIRRILVDFFVPWTNRIRKEIKMQPGEAMKLALQLCFPEPLGEYQLRGENGETCFHAAVVVGDMEILLMLLETVKAVLKNYNCPYLFLTPFTNIQGQTAMELAIACSHAEMAKVLWLNTNEEKFDINRRFCGTVGDYGALLDGQDLTGIVNQFIQGFRKSMTGRDKEYDGITTAYGKTHMLSILVVMEEFDLAYKILQEYGSKLENNKDEIVDDLDEALTHFPRRSRNNHHFDEEEFLRKRLNMYACLLAAGAKYHEHGSRLKILKDPQTPEELVLFYNDFMANKEEAARLEITLKDVVIGSFQAAAEHLREGFISPR